MGFDVPLHVPVVFEASSAEWAVKAKDLVRACKCVTFHFCFAFVAGVGFFLQTLSFQTYKPMEVIHKRRKICDFSLSEAVCKPAFACLTMSNLHSLGYSEAAIRLSFAAVAEFRLEVLEGHWDEAAAVVLAFSLQKEVETEVLYCLKQQKYLELLEKQDSVKALECLRTELAPLKPDETATLHSLASLLLCSSAKELMEAIGWEGSGPQARLHLLLKATACILPATESSNFSSLPKSQ